MTRHLLALTCVLGGLGLAQDPGPKVHLSRFGAGTGPVRADAVTRILDANGTHGQSNAIAFDRVEQGAFEATTFTCSLRVLKGGDGGAVAFLNTAEYGARGPAPFVASWVEPNLKRTFAVGIDVHNPKSEEMFGPWGNYRGMPQREVSLHWDGREIVKRVAGKEFRGDWAACEIVMRHVVGGAEVTVSLAGEKVYDRTFIAGLYPYESRLAIGAGTRADVATEFDLKDIVCERAEPARRRRPPARIEVFNHVLTNNAKTAYEQEVALPPRNWEFGRVILTLEIHDAGPDWDEWDRNGEVSVFDKQGQKHGILPFITSYRTACRWDVDVTHFRPWLCDATRFEVRAGTTFYKNRGYMMSVTLSFHHGRNELDPYRVDPLWVGTAHHGSAENHFRDFFSPREVPIDAECRAARLWMTTTGHSQVGEFTPSKRAIVVGEQRFENVLWKDDCYLNPNRPQFGTWKFSRAGWAPGDVVRPWWIDLTPHVEPGRTAVIRYEPQPYDFGVGERPADKQIAQASHVVRSYLIRYRATAATMPAPTVMVTNVQAKSNAARAGVKRGDYLASYAGKPLHSIDDLRAAMRALPGDPAPGNIAVVIYRGAERLELQLDPGPMGVNLAER